MFLQRPAVLDEGDAHIHVGRDVRESALDVVAVSLEHKQDAVVRVGAGAGHGRVAGGCHVLFALDLSTTRGHRWWSECVL